MSCIRLAGVIAIVALVGCGGGSKSKSPSTAAPKTSQQEAPVAATTATEAPAKAGGLTPMGSTLEVGKTAVIAYDDASNHKKSRIEVTPQKVEKGTLDDFKNIKLEGNEKTSTPYYVTMKVTNVGKGDLSGTDPAAYIDGIDDRGQEQNEIIFFGEFQRCKGGDAKSLKPGESYSRCLAYLIPGGGSIKGMRWIEFDQKTGKANIDWK